jgi:hypothetical protein
MGGRSEEVGGRVVYPTWIRRMDRMNGFLGVGWHPVNPANPCSYMKDMDGQDGQDYWFASC